MVRFSKYKVNLPGPYHIKKGIPCQDAYCIRETPGGVIFAAVADGLGSEEHSDKCAKIDMPVICMLNKQNSLMKKTVKRLSNPAVTSASKTSNGINVKWSKVTGATGYVVYRKTAKGSWSRIANIKSGSTTSYTDTKASRGVTYTYTVRAYNGSTMSSFNSTKSAKR